MNVVYMHSHTAASRSCLVAAPALQGLAAHVWQEGA